MNNDVNSMFELFPSIAGNVDVYCQPDLLAEEPKEVTTYTYRVGTKKNIMTNPFTKETIKSKEPTRPQEIVLSGEDGEPKIVYRCKYPNCDKNFARLSYLLQHEFTHTGVMPYQCRKCKEQFFKKCDYIDHKKLHKLEKRRLKEETEKEKQEREK